MTGVSVRLVGADEAPSEADSHPVGCPDANWMVARRPCRLPPPPLVIWTSRGLGAVPPTAPENATSVGLATMEGPGPTVTDAVPDMSRNVARTTADPGARACAVPSPSTETTVGVPLDHATDAPDSVLP